MLAEAILLTAIVLILWHHIGYPLTVGAVYSIRASSRASEPESGRTEPPITVVITAYNEAETILDRIDNCYETNYPREKLEVILASDGSTDDTVPLVEQCHPEVTVVDSTGRDKAKTRTLGVERADTDIIVFTDAQTRFHPDCLRNLARHFSEDSVGVVGGKLTSPDFDDGDIGTTMRLYWRWEYFLREAHSTLDLLPKLSGANLAVRRSCYRQTSPYVDVDQTVGFDAVRNGYSVRHESTAVATEQFPTDLGGEFHTRRRLTAQACTTLWSYRDVLDPRKRLGLFVSTVSYWHLRYVVPWLLLTVFVTSALLAAANPISQTLFVLGSVGLVAAGVGFVLNRLGASLQPFSFAFAFLWVNFGILVGTVEFLTGRRINSYDA